MLWHSLTELLEDRYKEGSGYALYSGAHGCHDYNLCDLSYGGFAIPTLWFLPHITGNGHHHAEVK